MRTSHYAQRRQWIHSTLKTRAGETATQPPNATTNATQIKATAGSTLNKDTITKPERKRGGGVARTVFSWTPEQDAKIIELRLEGNSWEEVAQVLERPHKAIRQRYMKDLNPALHQGWDASKIERLNAAVAAKKSWRQISNEFVMPQPTVREKWMSLNPELVMKIKESKPKRRYKPSRLILRKARLGPFNETGFVSAKMRKWTDLTDTLLLDYKNQGFSWRQIGSIFIIAPMACFSRFNYIVKTKLKAGWIPLKLGASDLPPYLLPSRRASTSKVTGVLDDNDKGTITPAPSEEFLNTQDGPSEPLNDDILGFLNEDFSYTVQDAPPPRIWTKEEDEYILSSRSALIPFTEIASHLNLEVRECFLRYHTALDPEFKDKKWTPKSVEKLLFYVSQGVPWTSIARSLGFNRVICREKYREITEPWPSQRDPSDETVQGVGNSAPTTATVQSNDEYIDEDDEQDPEQDESFELDEYEDSDEPNDLEDDIVDYTHDDYNQVNINDNDEDADAIDVNDDDADDMLDSSSSYHSEGFAEDPVRTGRRSKKQNSITPPSSILSDLWDKESVLKEIKKTWTTKEETELIQHVIRNGTRGWEEISSALNGRHSADECQAYWKYLDMPLHEYRPQVQKWETHREAHFWRLWLEHGSDFEVISRRLDKSSAIEVESNQNEDRRYGPKDCEELFTERTRSLISGSDNEMDSETFHQDCVKLALARSIPPQFQWSKKTSVKLQKLVLQRLRTRGVHVDWINWKWVARHVGHGATAQRCSIHWRVLRTTEMQKGDWTDQDILLLEKGVREVGSIFNRETNPYQLSPPGQGSDGYEEPSIEGFRAIQKFYLPHMSVETLQRKFFLLSDKASRVSLREYMAIMDAVDKFGENQWDKVVESLKSQPSDNQGSGFTGWTKAPCRRVWESSYKYQLLNTVWNEAEDEDLKVVVDRVGQKDWISVSRFFPGKSSWQCRLRWCQLTDPVQ
ncbi:Myblike DNAbinding domain-containing protein [Entomortierella lignicola]|nr:Myblike DNAbinding domain-containing protein [Entomortierella lignicola]